MSTLARELLGRGHLVSVVTASYAGVTTPERFQGDSLTIHVVAGRKRARERARDLWSPERKAMKELLRVIKPDVVNAHWTYEFALAALESGLPTLVTAHDAPVTMLRHFHDPYRTARLAMAVSVRVKRPPLTAVSPYLAERWRREMGWRRDIAIIPNMSPFGPREGGREHQHRHRVVTVADSSERKNVRSALEAWPLVLRAFPSAELHLVGHGLGPSEGLALWAEQHSLQRQVSWHGSVDRAEVEHLIESATVLLHPSLEESLGITIVEAMALGVAVVGGTTSGAVPWTMGNCGALTEVRSPSAIAATVIDLLRDPHWRMRNGEAGKRRVADTFSPEAVARAYEQQYEAVRAGKPCWTEEGRS